MELLVDGEKEKFRAGLLKALGELGIAQERIVTLEGALRAVEWAIAHYATLDGEETEDITYRQCPDCLGPDREDEIGPPGHFPGCQLDLALCDHRGGCTHIEAT